MAGIVDPNFSLAIQTLGFIHSKFFSNYSSGGHHAFEYKLFSSSSSNVWHLSFKILFIPTEPFQDGHSYFSLGLLSSIWNHFLMYFLTLKLKLEKKCLLWYGSNNIERNWTCHQVLKAFFGRLGKSKNALHHRKVWCDRAIHVQYSLQTGSPYGLFWDLLSNS